MATTIRYSHDAPGTPALSETAFSPCADPSSCPRSLGPQWQNDALLTLTDMGDGQRYLQQCAMYMRALGQAYRGRGSNNTYSAADTPVRAGGGMRVV